MRAYYTEEAKMPVETQISYAIVIGAFIVGAAIAYLGHVILEKLAGKRILSFISLIGLVGVVASFCSIIGLMAAALTSPLLVQRFDLATPTATITSTATPTPTASAVPTSTPTTLQLTETPSATITPTISPERLAEICKGIIPIVFTSGIPDTNPCQGRESLDIVLDVWIIVEPRTQQGRQSGQCRFIYPDGDRSGFIEGSMWILRVDDSIRAELPLCPVLQLIP